MTSHQTSPLADLRLEGASNFRDFGGYETDNAQRVRRGLLFRSNKLSGLTEGDLAKLDAAGIRTIFDLRTDDERQRDPTSWSHPELVIETYPPGLKRRLLDMAQDYTPTLEGAVEMMHVFYGGLPVSMAHMFRSIMQRLAAGGAPCVIHCTAGKDRTGVAVALVLSALGVPRETIVADYTLTRERWNLAADTARSKEAGGNTGNIVEARQRYAPEARAAIIDAAPTYIAAALQVVDERYGTIEGYFAQALELEPQVVVAMRERLLEPA